MTKKSDTKRFWVSWWEPYENGDDDVRPRKWPLKNGILNYWNSGSREDAASICALIEAESEEAVEQAVAKQGWSPKEWRFIEEKPSDWTPGSRFPMQSPK